MFYFESDNRIFLLQLLSRLGLPAVITITLAQLKHSNVRALKFRPADLDRTSIGARQFGQKLLSILLDVKQKSESVADMSFSLGSIQLQ
jgi:hypothetical protein